MQKHCKVTKQFVQHYWFVSEVQYDTIRLLNFNPAHFLQGWRVVSSGVLVQAGHLICRPITVRF